MSESKMCACGNPDDEIIKKMIEFKMPLLKSYIPDGFPKCVRIPMECEERAKSNHGGQDFEMLASRGGVGPEEAIALMEDRRWKKMNVIELVDAFRKYHWL